MKPLFVIITFLVLISCSSEEKTKKEKQVISKKTEVIEYDKRSLEEIKESGVLRVSTTYSATSYFLYKGKTMGFEYELLERFAKHLGVQLEIVVANDIDNLIPN